MHAVRIAALTLVALVLPLRGEAVPVGLAVLLAAATVLGTIAGVRWQPDGAGAERLLRAAAVSSLVGTAVLVAFAPGVV